MKVSGVSALKDTFFNHDLEAGNYDRSGSMRPWKGPLKKGDSLYWKGFNCVIPASDHNLKRREFALEVGRLVAQAGKILILFYRAKYCTSIH